ncbi:WSSV478 [White spot syndrome virus]|uniref:WSSV478 n=1 Tax=White spot syndrome virus TaxID=342409 RepID=A0A2I6SCF3_9VIRU|nr:WSSV478 [White spot syndrome virus]
MCPSRRYYFSASSAFDKHDDDVATDAAYRNVNPFTTVEEAYLHYESGGVITGGGKKGTTYITKKRVCRFVCGAKGSFPSQ